MGVLVFIVVEVYECFVVEGLISVWVGFGFYVNGLVVLLVLVEMEFWFDCVVDLLWVLWQLLEILLGYFKLGCGWLFSDWLYYDGMCRGLCWLVCVDVVYLVDYVGLFGLFVLCQLL